MFALLSESSYMCLEPFIWVLNLLTSVHFFLTGFKRTTGGFRKQMFHVSGWVRACADMEARRGEDNILVFSLSA